MTEIPKIESLDHDAVRKVLADHVLAQSTDRAEGQDADFSYNAVTGFDFSGIDLSGVHFQGAILQGCRFTSAILHDTDFSDARVPDTDFSGADLVRAAMTDSVFRNCCFDGGNLGGIRFYDADLAGASFRNAELTGADISGCDLTGAIFDAACVEWACIENNLSSGSSWVGVRGQLRLGELPK